MPLSRGREGEMGPRLTQCALGWGLLSYQVASWSIQQFGYKRHGLKIGGSAPFRERGWVPIYPNVAWAEAYLPTKWHHDPSSHLATTNMGRKLKAVPLWGGELDSHLAQCRLGWGLPPYQVESWSIQPFRHNRYGPKIGGLPPLGWGKLSPHLTQCGRGLPAHQVSSWSVQPFGHNTPMSQTGQTDRTDRQHRANRFTNGRPKNRNVK